MTLTKEQKDLIYAMRNAGYAVIIWTPEELGDTDPEWVQDCSIQYGNEYLIGQSEE